MHEQVILNLKEAVKDVIKKEDLDNKEYGFKIARDLYCNMTLLDLHNYFANKGGFVSRLSPGSLWDIPFEEAEEAVLKWREEKGARKNDRV